MPSRYNLPWILLPVGKPSWDAEILMTVMEHETTITRPDRR